MFDPNQFLDMPMTEANDTVALPVPEGEFVACVESVNIRPWAKKDDPSQGGLALDLIWAVDDQGVKETLGRDKVTVKQGIMLDLTPTGSMDMSKGKNISLGRLRDAVGLNEPGQAFSFSMLTGRVAKVKVSHRINGEQIYAEVKAVLKLA